jgi:hypothetical protein
MQESLAFGISAQGVIFSQGVVASYLVCEALVHLCRGKHCVWVVNLLPTAGSTTSSSRMQGEGTRLECLILSMREAFNHLPTTKCLQLTGCTWSLLDTSMSSFGSTM